MPVLWRTQGDFERPLHVTLGCSGVRDTTPLASKLSIEVHFKLPFDDFKLTARASGACTYETTRVSIRHRSLIGLTTRARRSVLCPRPPEYQVVREQLPLDVNAMAGPGYLTLHGNA